MITDARFAKIVLVVWFILLSSWIWNAIEFISCDFESDFRCEVIHGAGLFVPVLAIVTVWFDTDD